MYNLIFYILFYVLNTQFCSKQLSIPAFAIVTQVVFSDLALWRHHNWDMTSRECGVLALWRHIRRLFLHTQSGVQAIFISE